MLPLIRGGASSAECLSRRGRASSAQPLDITMVPGIANQIRDVYMVFSDYTSHGHRQLHSHRPRQGPQRQRGLELHHDLRRQGWLLTRGYSSPTSCLQFQLSSQCSNWSTYFFLPFVHHILAHCSGSHCWQATQLVGLWVTSSIAVAW